MTKQQAYDQASRHSKEAAFAANLILCWQPSAAKRLKGLARRLAAGQEIRVAQFDISRLVINGEYTTFAALEV
jgi:hypothetical protein